MIYKQEKPMNKQYKKINIPMCIAFILLCLTLITIHFTSDIYARYTITDQSFDSAKSISFGNLNITETGDFVNSNNMMIIPGVNINKKAVVNFEGSESESYVFLEMLLSPSGRWQTENNEAFTLKLNEKEIMNLTIMDKWSYLTDVSDGKYVFYQMVNSNTRFNETIIKDNTISVNDLITKNDMKEINNFGNINIKFRATAIQSIGFNSPEEAWNSIKD